MNCPRCDSKMLFEKFYGKSECFWGWHCVMCGEIIDPVILLHRETGDPNAELPRTEPERPLPVFVKYRDRKPSNTTPKPCLECGEMFIPIRNGKTHCRDPKCLDWKKSRGGYLGAVIRFGMARELAIRKSFEKYPGLKDKSTHEIVGIKEMEILNEAS